MLEEAVESIMYIVDITATASYNSRVYHHPYHRGRRKCVIAKVGIDAYEDASLAVHVKKQCSDLD